MPTYEYACTECGEQTEVVQKFSDDPLTVCSACGGRLRKVFSPVGIVFKGGGFYRTDSRAAAKEPVAAGQQNGSAAGAKSADKSGEPSKSGAKDAGSPGAGSPGAGSPGTGSSSGSGSSGSSSSANGSSGASGSRGSSSGGKRSSTKVA